MTVKVDTRVTPAFDPESFKMLEGYNDETAVVVGSAASVFEDVYVTLGKIHEARIAVGKNPAMTSEARLLAVSDFARKHEERLTRKLDAAERTLEISIASLEQELTRPVQERAGLGNLNQEVRAYARSLDRAKLNKLMNESLEKKDTDTLTAICGAQPFLSGLSQEDHKWFTRKLHEMQNPAHVARLTLLKSAAEKVGRDSRLIFPQIDKAVGATRQEVRAIKAANDAALASLRIEA